ncbi:MULTISPECIES: DUF4249 domain-containing protein [Flavobacteriaceae]|uniref:DUF4249 domain-containing protein n=1 Tax=Flavobacteriaceae TaxID=49546 RepID=UPI0014926A83|nr:MULTISPECIES: DUF4249 domain-containing protein [Allomuricauda]MDC6364838.1 DUF4249 domain-containing protein [Muricauda sp. AC10]
MKLTKRRNITNILIAFFGIIHYGCIEPFVTSFENFESALVIEATITDELRQQRVLLTRTYEFEEDGPSAVTGAIVSVDDGSGNVYDFADTGEGIYVSSQAFAAQPNRDYKLSVRTSNGRSYASSSVQLTSAVSLDNVSAKRITTDLEEDGIAILVSAFDPTGNAKNFRYEYEETFKIIAPTWTPVSLIGDPEGGCGVIKVPNTADEEVCYRTDLSNRIVLASTEDLKENRIENFRVRFISSENYIISHRYSILVRQLVQSNEAFTFYETLNELSSSESLFSQVQPGFLEGNVFSEDDENERVLGFFDVSSVSEQRIFFNYRDFYQDEPLPPYADACSPSAPVIANMGGCVLRPIIESGAGIYAEDNPEIGANEGPYLIVPRVCGDCRELGTTEEPAFWTE